MERLSHFRDSDKMLWKRESHGVSFGDHKYFLSVAYDCAGGSTPTVLFYHQQMQEPHASSCYRGTVMYEDV